MTKVRVPTEEELENIKLSLEVDESSYTGLRWKIKRIRSEIGDPAFTTCKKGDRNYFYGNLNDKTYRAHRVVFFILNGYWPLGDIDHIDGNRQNNAGWNLREVDRSANNVNRSLSKGYRWHKKSNCWQARLNRGGREYVKYCKTEEEAKQAYLDLKNEKYPELEGNFRGK